MHQPTPSARVSASATEDLGAALTSPLRFCEIFAGSAILSSTASLHGFDVLAVDHDRNEHTPKYPLLFLDLTDRSGQAAFTSCRIPPLFLNI